MEMLVGYLAFLYLMTKLIVNAIEQEAWGWLVVFLVITIIGVIVYYHSR